MPMTPRPRAIAPAIASMTSVNDVRASESKDRCVAPQDG
jgi:hypothetical protein